MHGNVLLFHFHPKGKAEGLNNLPRDRESKPESKQRIKSRSPTALAGSCPNNQLFLIWPWHQATEHRQKEHGQHHNNQTSSSRAFPDTISWLFFLCVGPKAEPQLRRAHNECWMGSSAGMPSFSAQAPAGSGSAENWDCWGLFCLSSICYT